MAGCVARLRQLTASHCNASSVSRRKSTTDGSCRGSADQILAISVRLTASMRLSLSSSRATVCGKNSCFHFWTRSSPREPSPLSRDSFLDARCCSELLLQAAQGAGHGMRDSRQGTGPRRISGYHQESTTGCGCPHSEWWGLTNAPVQRIPPSRSVLPLPQTAASRSLAYYCRNKDPHSCSRAPGGRTE